MRQYARPGEGGQIELLRNQGWIRQGELPEAPPRLQRVSPWRESAWTGEGAWVFAVAFVLGGGLIGVSPSDSGACCDPVVERRGVPS